MPKLDQTIMSNVAGDAAGRLPALLMQWLLAHAPALDDGSGASGEVVPRLGEAGLLRIGVPAQHGGSGGDGRDAVLAIAAVAEHSLAAAFMFWGQRTFIEYLLQGTNAPLRARLLPSLLGGALAGATGLSNAMKFLAAIEPLQLHAVPEGDGWRIDGRLPWVTNLDPAGFVVAAAAEREGAPPCIVALSSRTAGVERTRDLDLIGLRGSHTAAVDLRGVVVSADDLLADDARSFLPRVRPAFLGMQCGLAIGLARASLRAAHERAAGARSVLAAPIQTTRTSLDRAVAELLQGLDDGRFVERAAPLFRLRIRLAELAQLAVQIELQATGGRAFMRGDDGIARRWTEAALVPLITPSLTQLQGALQAQAGPADVHAHAAAAPRAAFA